MSRITVYKDIAKSKKTPKGRKVIYTFGRLDSLAAAPTSEGGYFIYKIEDASTRSGQGRRWVVVYPKDPNSPTGRKGLPHKEVVDKMNKLLGRKAFNHAVVKENRMRSFKQYITEARKKKQAAKKMVDDGWKKETIEISCDCLMCQAKEVTEMAMPTHNLPQLFTQLNGKYWGNEIPKVPVKYASLKGKTGVAGATFFSKGTGRNKEYRLDKLSYIKINKNVLMDVNYTSDIMMHEMIHLKMFMQNIFRTSGGDKAHGKEFLDEKRTREKIYPRSIPVSDDVKHALSDNATKKHGIFTYEKPDGTFVYQLYNLGPWQKEQASLIFTVQRILKQVKDKNISTHLLNYKIVVGTIEGTLHIDTKVKRGFIMGKLFSGYQASPEEKTMILKTMKNKNEIKYDPNLFTSKEVR